MKKDSIIKYIYMLFPLINLLTGLMTRYNVFPLSIGIVVRILLLMFLVIYVMFYCKSKYKKRTITYFILLAIFCVLYIITKPEYFSFKILFSEAQHLLKFLYLPIIFFGLLNLFDEYGYNEKEWNSIILFSLIFHIAFIIIPIILKNSFHSYVLEERGLVGWFYAANEIGPCLLLLFPSIFILKDRKNIFCICAILAIFSVLALSTKVVYLGLGIIIITYLILNIIFNSKNTKQKKYILFALAVYLITVSGIGTNFYNYLEKNNTNKISIKSEEDNNVSTNKDVLQNNSHINNNAQNDKNNENNLITNEESKFEIILSKVLSNRNKKAYIINDKYISSSFFNKLFGIGFYDVEKQDVFLSEMDFVDMFYCYGIIGFILLCIPHLYIIYLITKKIFEKNRVLSLEMIYIIVVILMLYGVSFLSGHVLGAPTVSTYLVLYMVRIYLIDKNITN